MKHLRFTAFFFLIVFLIVLLSPSSSGQSTQPPMQTQSPSLGSPQQPGDVSGPVNSQPALRGPGAASSDPLSQRRFRIKFLPQGPPPKRPKLLPDPPLVPGVSGQRVADSSDGTSPQRQSQQSVDPGIVLKVRTGNMCGSIVSYNFSPGDNPQLESVTTCTPADAVVTRRAQGKDKKPPAPSFRTTVLSTPQQ